MHKNIVAMRARVGFIVNLAAVFNPQYRILHTCRAGDEFLALLAFCHQVM